jgi:thiamine-monophosphate kinase
VLPTVAQFTSANSVGITLDLDRLTVPMEGIALDIDPARLWLGWGDWNVIAAIRSSDMLRLNEVCSQESFGAWQIGEFIEGEPHVLLKRVEETQIAPRLESERFASDSWFIEF